MALKKRIVILKHVCILSIMSIMSGEKKWMLNSLSPFYNCDKHQDTIPLFCTPTKGTCSFSFGNLFNERKLKA